MALFCRLSLLTDIKRLAVRSPVSTDPLYAFPHLPLFFLMTGYGPLFQLSDLLRACCFLSLRSRPPPLLHNIFQIGRHSTQLHYYPSPVHRLAISSLPNLPFSPFAFCFLFIALFAVCLAPLKEAQSSFGYATLWFFSPINLCVVFGPR